MNFYSYLILIIFILNFCSLEIICSECNSCNSDDNINCRKDVISQACVYCEGISNSESKYYKIEINEGDQTSYNCVIINKDNIAEEDKLYEGTYQLGDCSSSSYYSLGNICYSGTPNSNIIEPINEGENKYKCIDTFTLIEKDGLKSYICYSNTKKCNGEYKYYDGETNLCLKSPPSGDLKYIKKEYSENTVIFRYTKNCKEMEFTYKETDTSGKINYYCLADCPDKAKYHKSNEFNCLEECDISGGEISDGNICISKEDSNKYIKVDPNKKIYSTINGEACPVDYPYLYTPDKSYCLKSCKDTNSQYFNNQITYSYEYKCTETAPTVEGIEFYLDKESLKWVTDCKVSPSGPYFYVDTENGNLKICNNSCQKNINDDTLECVDDCTRDNAYLNEKICYKKCPSYLGKGFYKTTNDGKKICTSCNGDNEFYKIEDSNNECYPTCPGDSKHNFGENGCYEGDCQDDYKYSVDGSNICYKSCLDIKDNENSYTIEKDYKCYTDSDNLGDISNYIYYQTSGIIKYIKNQDNAPLKECFSVGLKYLDNSQCILDCNNGYKVLPTTENFGLCFNEYSACKEKGYLYYNATKICSEVCNLFEVIYEEIELPTETCVQKCPENDYYTNEYTKKCVKACGSDYYTDISLKKCVTQCDSGFYKIKDDEKICVEKCTKLENNEEINSYYLKDGQCVDICPIEEGDEVLKYSFNNKDSHQPCIRECPEDKKYYLYEGGNICYEECKLYKDEYCVDSCSTEYIHPGNICSDEPCPQYAPFFYIKNEETGEVQPKICLSNCAEEGFNYFIVSQDENEKNKCTRSCDNGYFYNGGCYSQCPEGLYHETFIVDGKTEKNCTLKCGNGKKFYKDNINRYICVNSCDEITENDGTLATEYIYVTSSKECVKKCPNGENYINENNECNNKCKNSEYFFEEFQGITEDNPYIIYKCKEACDNSEKLYHIYGQKECIASCNDLFEYEADHTCFSNCINNKNANYSLMKEPDDSTSKNKCVISCAELGKYYGNDNVCRSDCSVYANNKTINESDNRCISHCDLKSKYKFLQAKESGEAKPLYCRDKCYQTDSDSLSLPIRFSTSNYICISKCEAPNNYVVIDGNSEYANQCLSECPKDNNYYIRENDKGEYICSTLKCEDGNDGYNKYYMDTNICLKECNKLYSYRYNSKDYCVTSCDFFKDKKLYHDEEENSDGTITTYNYRCVETCDNPRPYLKLNGYCSDEECENSFYFESDKICLLKCPKNSTTEEGGKKCIKCTDFSPKKFIDENGNCIDDCSTSKTGYIYHNKIIDNTGADAPNEENIDDYLCLNSCSDKKIEGKLCVDSCTEDNPFNNDNICVDICPFTKRFFLPEDAEKNCLNDCPLNKKYYIINEEGENDDKKTYYKCQEDCQAYVPNTYPNFNSTYCFEDGKCKNDYSYFEMDEDNKKKCLSQCPSNKSYIKEGETEDIECYEKCPDNLIHLPDSYLCQEISVCTSKTIRYKDKECVNACSKTEKSFTDDNSITYCVDNCTQTSLPESITGEDNDLFLTEDNKCVKTCPDGSSSINNKCECNNLYYIDKSTLNKYCLTVDQCENAQNYQIIIFGTKECTDYCDGILSSSGKECHPNNYTCNENKEIITSLPNGKKKCDCAYKYYYEDNENKVKKCLSKNENCPSSTHKYFIPDTKECVPECPTEEYNIKFGDTCLSKCPPLTQKNEETQECECVDKYYIDKDNIKVCLEKDNDCPEDYPLTEGDNSKLCIDKCSDGKNLDYNKKQCVDNDQCDTKTESKSTEGDSIAEKYAALKCSCKKNWYYDPITLEEICDDGEKDCSTLTNSIYNYIIFATNQCVKSCSGVYKFIFGKQCFKSCIEASTLTNKDLRQDGNNKCKCNEFSNYDDLTECFSLEQCINNNDYSVIDDTTNNIKQCYKKNGDKKCPKEYPVFFNGYCYKENQCPTNSQYNKFTQTCECKYLWYEENSLITCLPSTIKSCSSVEGYPLLISSTNQCIESDNEEKNNYFELNNILYVSCPDDTKPIEEGGSKKCICNNRKKWYREQGLDGRAFLKCEQEECPKEKPYIDKETNTNECLATCGDKFIYRQICYNNCPELTEEGNNKECILKQVNDDLNLANLEETMTNNLLVLFNSNEGGENVTSSQKIVTKEATVEFYGVNKKNKGNSQQNIHSDLSYIDISECIENIYKSNGMDSDANIIILKFDKNDVPKNYLINPVEYKFINSKTGQKLDATVCQHNSIKISYPLHDLINKFDQLMRKKRNLEYKQIDLISNNKDTLSEKLEKGKEISSKYSDSDIFNINDKIYSDICIAVEVDGKDLVLKDRINYFYPKMSLCENNCTYNHTDFANERIYCDCSYKQEFDFSREYFPSIDINYNQIKNDQGGNSNIGVIKCISNLKYSKSLSGNYGFAFILIIIIIEFILLMVIIFYEIKYLLDKLKNKIKNDDNEDKDKIEVNVVNINSNEKNETETEKEKESERNLNAPPKKKEEYGIEFIPQEYVFLFFNQNEKGVIKKVERDGVPFKTKYNTRILLEKTKGVNYDNLKSRGPFPDNQNILVIVDNMNENISDYINADEEGDEGRNNGIKNTEENNMNQKYDSLSAKLHKKNKKMSEKYKENREELEQKPKLYQKKKIEFTISDYDPSDENYSEIYFDEDEDDNIKQEKGILESIKKEQRLLKKNYEFSSKYKKSSNFIVVLFTEIIDKIYITKILLFTRKFDILSMQLSIYFLCHTLLLILLALFYDIETIEKIWNNDDFPGLGYYLLYGFISCIIIWIIYSIILCLWSNNDKIKNILRMIHGSKKYGVDKNKDINIKYKNLAWKIKFKVAIYSVIEFLLLAFCFVYFVTFCTVYTGTMGKVFKSYGIALIEVLIIKIIYGIVLAILRKISLDKENKTLYNIILFMNTYLV